VANATLPPSRKNWPLVSETGSRACPPRDPTDLHCTVVVVLVGTAAEREADARIIARTIEICILENLENVEVGGRD
jgi:hypothetical protein